MIVKPQAGTSRIRAALVAMIFAFAGSARWTSLPLEPAKAYSFPQPATKVVLLGTGTPNADPDRSGPAIAIVVNDTPYLVDCGPGVVRRAAAAARSGIKGIEPHNLKTA